MKTLVLATTNAGKVEWYRNYLDKYKNDIALLNLGDFSNIQVVDEPFDTAEENARYKAKEYSRVLGENVLATDIALYVDFFSDKQQPGAHVRRSQDRTIRMTDQEVYDYWLEKLKRLRGKHGGYWHKAFCIWSKDGQCIESTYDRKFVFRPDRAMQYTAGLPLSGLCYNEETDKMHAEMTKEDILFAYNDLQLVFDRMIREFLDINTNLART